MPGLSLASQDVDVVNYGALDAIRSVPEADASADAGTGLPLAARYRPGGDASTGTLRLSTATARRGTPKCRHMQFRLAGGLRLGQPIMGGQPYDSVARALLCRAPRHTRRCRSERGEHLPALEQ